MKVLLVFIFLVAEAAACAQTVPTQYRGFTLGVTTVQQFLDQMLDRNTCVKPKGDGLKRACKEIENAQKGLAAFMKDKDGITTWLFNQGVLCSVKIEKSLGLSTFDEQIELISQKYGKPISQDTEILQNNYGAYWGVGRAQWDMPDGTTISAKEYIRNGLREITVQYVSKQELDRLTAIDQKK